MTQETKAYYRGRNHGFNQDAKLARNDFATAAEWESYKRGYRHAIAEDMLDACTEWDD
jgi:dienelactone hydrolase